MNAPADLVTVYRSMDATAKEDCEDILDLLTENGIAAVMLDDSAPEVPEGTFEVCVPPGDADKAEKLMAENPLPDEVEEVDNSDNLNLETIYHAEGSGTIAELEAMGIKNLLESNGIAAVLVGDAVLPNLPFEVRVARDKAGLAREVIATAEPTEQQE